MSAHTTAPAPAEKPHNPPSRRRPESPVSRHKPSYAGKSHRVETCSALYVKALPRLIESLPASYDQIAAAVATREGTTRGEIGRCRWTDLLPMWNLPREGFKHLYEQTPGDKPLFEEVWRATGGTPVSARAIRD